jgi:subtilisin family serine protease
MNNRRRIPLLLVLALTLASALGASSESHAKGKPLPAVAGELLIGFESDVGAAEQKAMLKKVGASEKQKFKRINGTLAKVRPEDVDKALAQLRRDKRVRYAEPNVVFSVDAATSDPFYSRLWGLENTGQAVDGYPGTPDADIDAPEAWAVTTGSTAVTVAVIDTGVDHAHPDLSAAIWINPGENCAGCRTDGVDNDGNGYKDDWRGWDFAHDDNNPADDHGHGTHVAGTIGAIGDNGIGITGVAQRAEIMPLKFLRADGTGTAADAIGAILYATQNGADILNNSWGGEDFSQALEDAVAASDAAGALFVAAAGNDSSDNDAAPTFPSSFDLPNVISVAATDNTDELAWFSNAGRQSVDLAAPGLEIFSTWPGGSYQSISGTSMAAPHVAGAAALAKAAFPGATGVGLKALLLDSTDPKASLADLTASGGRLNAGSALGCVDAPRLWLETPGPGFDVEVGSALTVRAIATRCGQTGGATVSASANGNSIALTHRGDGLYSGSFTPTVAGPLTFSATASAGAATETRTITGVASGVYELAIGGPPLTITTHTAQQNARARFTGQAGQRISLRLSNVSIPLSYVSILKPGGGTLAPASFVGTSGSFIDTRTLPAAGTYTIVVDPQAGAGGSMTLTLYDVPADAGGPIATGTPATIAAGTPGQNARLTFSGQPGGRISIKLSGSTVPASYVSLLKPDGNILGNRTYVGTAASFIDKVVLPSAGTYTILVDPLAAATGSMTVTMYEVPPDAGGPVAFDSPTAMTATTPGQNGRFTFNGTAGQRVSLKLSSVTIGGTYVSLLKADGTAVGGKTYTGTAGSFVDTRTLPAVGSYTVFVDPQGTSTGSMTLTLYDVPADAGGPIIAGGSAVTGSATTPGQNARFTFDGAAGQRVSIKLSATTISSSYVSILEPDGTALGNSTFVGVSGGFVDTQALPSAGSYTILVDPQGTATGSIAATLYDVPADVIHSTTSGGPALTLALSTPGQNAKVTFPGSAGQRLSLRFTGVTILSSYVTILRPDGTQLGSKNLITTTGRTITFDLQAAGTYTISIDPQAAATGSMTLALGPAA